VIDALFRRIGALPFTPCSHFTVLSAIIFLRTVAENLVESGGVILKLSPYGVLLDLVHIYFSWLTLYVAATVAVWLFAKEPFGRVAKVTLVGFFLILIVPFCDWLCFGAGTIRYNYDFSNFGYAFVHLFDPGASIDFVTGGVRLEIGLVVVLASLYGARFALWRGVAAAVALYVLIFLFGYLPAFFASLAPHYEPIRFHLLLYMPLLWGAGLFVAWYYRSLFRHIVRPSRVAPYMGLLLFGYFLAKKESLEEFGMADLPVVGLALLALVLLFVYSVILNDLADRDIDRMTNKERNLVQGRIDPENYRCIGNVALFLGLMTSFGVGVASWMAALGIFSLSYLYSAPPLRLRRFVAVGNLLLALIALLALLMGYVAADPYGVPRDGELMAVVGGLFFAVSLLKDIKDIAGDRANGVVTVASLLRRRLWMVRLVAIGAMGVGAWLLFGREGVWLFAPLLFGLWIRDGERLLLFLEGVAALMGLFYLWRG